MPATKARSRAASAHRTRTTFDLLARPVMVCVCNSYGNTRNVDAFRAGCQKRCKNIHHRQRKVGDERKELVPGHHTARLFWPITCARNVLVSSTKTIMKGAQENTYSKALRQVVLRTKSKQLQPKPQKESADAHSQRCHLAKAAVKNYMQGIQHHTQPY